MKTNGVRLNFYHWCKTSSSAFSKKNSVTTPIFWHVFGRAPSDLQLCFVQLKTLAPSARYSTCKYPVTLKPGLGVTQGHRKLYHSMRLMRAGERHGNPPQGNKELLVCLVSWNLLNNRITSMYVSKYHLDSRLKKNLFLWLMKCKKSNKCCNNQQCNEHFYFPGQQSHFP